MVSSRTLPSSFLCLLLTAVPAPAQTDEALHLRNLGLAQLENERDGEAEATFRRLVQKAPDDPIGYANLAITLLRQQRTDEAAAAIAAALEMAPERADLLVIQGDIVAWSGAQDRALDIFRRAVAAAPDSPEYLYSLFRHAEAMATDAARAAAADAVRQLARLRPDNLVVALELAALAVEEGDRETATGALLRLRELSFQLPDVAERFLDEGMRALEEGEVAEARGSVIRIGNLAKQSPAFKSSLVELYTGIQGIPVERFAREPEPTNFGEPASIRFAARSISPSATRDNALGVADLDGDDRPDLVRVRRGEGQDVDRLEVRYAKDDWRPGPSVEAPGVSHLLLVDLDNDEHLDILGYGPDVPLELWRLGEDRRLEPRAASFNLAGVVATAVEAFDFDSEGDLDLLLARADGSLELYRSTLEDELRKVEGVLEGIGTMAMPPLRPRRYDFLWASDLDRDGDLDLLMAHELGLTWLDSLRQGRFSNRTAVGGLRTSDPARIAISADLTNDGYPEVVSGGGSLGLFENIGGIFRPHESVGLSARDVSSIEAFDADNDGRLDLAFVAGGELRISAQRGSNLAFESVEIEGPRVGFSSVLSADLDSDGDLDLIAAGQSGLVIFDNQGGNQNHWLRVRARGLRKGNSKNNFFARGATAEVRAGRAYQFREIRSDVTHLGLGSRRRADSLRLVWANGVPQNRVDPEIDQLVVEEQVLKGSCPFLYTWDGDGIRFVTDLLWGAPLGMPLAEGIWNSADPKELVRVDGAQPNNGFYDLRITEELWEAAFFDYARLWVVDHPQGVEVASSLRIIPGQQVPDLVHGTADVRSIAKALDGAGRDVTERLRDRDEIYADGYRPSDYQGVASEPWSLTFDLGTAPASEIRLLLDGWIFPADASLNLAVSQRQDLDWVFTRLEVETTQGWQVLIDPMGFPAGKTKTMVIDTPPLPEGASRLRIKTSRWLHWDRIAWSTTRADAKVQVVAKLRPAEAELRFRGFSRMTRRAPNAPHHFDYTQVRSESPWLPFPGPYTRFGDVLPLLDQSDDLTVVLGAGDEMQLRFDSSQMPEPSPGFVRTIFLESHGWDKDADRNTHRAESVEPLPFHAMSGYPWGESENYPDTERHRRYRSEWLTRIVE